MRTKISDGNIFPVFDLEIEYKKIRTLCLKEGVFGRYMNNARLRSHPSLSYRDLLQEVFLKWHLRGSYTSLDEMLKTSGISEEEFANEVTEEKVLDYIQFTINAVSFLDKIADNDEYSVYKISDDVGNAIKKNCKYVAENLNAEIKKRRNEFFLIYKDDIATAVSIEAPELKESIIEYQKHATKGNLTRKKEILCTLYKRLEFYEKRFKNTSFSNMFSDTKYIFNKVARHEYKESDHDSAKFKAMDEITLEEWCNRAFQMFLGCMAVLPCIDIEKEIKKIKKNE